MILQKFTLAALLLLLPGGCCAEAPSPPSTPEPAATESEAPLRRFEYSALKLGSNYNLVLYAPDKPTADAAAKAAEAEIDRLDAVFSDYKADSEISLLSRQTKDGPMTQPARVSPDLWTMLSISRNAAERTGGAFDVTVGPYMQLWRRSRRQQELPSAQRLAEAKQGVGWRLMEVGKDEPTVRLLGTDMRLDVGGIATGYISQSVLEVLRKRGIDRAIVDLSGDLAIGNPPPGKKGWSVAIQSLAKPNDVVHTLLLANKGVSTSGDTYRFVELDGRRYSHIVDPKTGLGLTDRIGVTVIADDATTADWLSTAVSVLGREKGLALVEELNTTGDPTPEAAVRITELSGDRVETFENEGYRQLPRE